MMRHNRMSRPMALLGLVILLLGTASLAVCPDLKGQEGGWIARGNDASYCYWERFADTCVSQSGSGTGCGLQAGVHPKWMRSTWYPDTTSCDTEKETYGSERVAHAAESVCPGGP